MQNQADKYLQELVSTIFNSTYACIVTLDNLSLIFNSEGGVTTLDKKSDFNHNFGGIDMGRVEVIRDTSNDSDFIEMLNGGPRLTSDMDANKDDYDTMGPRDSNLTIAQLAEMLYLNGEVSLVNPRDADIMHSTIDSYLRQIEDMAMYSPHYKKPPLDDLNALEKMRNIIEPIALAFRGAGLGGSAFSNLLSLMDGETATGLSATSTDDLKVTLKGLDDTFAIGHAFQEGKNPYDFR